MRLPFYVAALLAALLGLGFVTARPGDPRLLPESAVDWSETYSNVLPDDYVGPATCAECHAEQYRLWRQHPHSCMNQLPGHDSVKGDFAGAELRLASGRVRFETDDDNNFFMRVERDGQPLRSYLVTRTVGSRFMQFYIGKQKTGPEPPEHPVYSEHMLPFAYWFKLGRWLPKNYFDADGPDELVDGIPQVEGLDHLRDVRPYSQICMNCHNTFPYAYRVFHGDLCGFPDATVAAALDPLSRALEQTIPIEPTLQSFASIGSRLDPDEHLVTLGISCESCHFGGREHALERKKIRFLPTSPMLQVMSHDAARPVFDNRANAPTVNGICAQCHSGHAKMFPNGAAVSNSREALDMHAGACTSQLRCVDCHEPHTAGKPSGGPVNPRHVALCVECHTQYREPAAAVAHAGHPTSAEVSCLDCHMPRFTQGLDELVRTHRIGMPVEEEMLAAGAPNACNQCHLDKSLRWTLDELDRHWHRRIEPRDDWAEHVRGNLDRPSGHVWLNSSEAYMRLLAAQSYARSPLGRRSMEEILQCLNDPEPINRVFATFAVERILGRRLPLEAIDITLPPAVRRQQISALAEEVGGEQGK